MVWAIRLRSLLSRLVISTGTCVCMAQAMSASMLSGPTSGVSLTSFNWCYPHEPRRLTETLKCNNDATSLLAVPIRLEMAFGQVVTEKLRLVYLRKLDRGCVLFWNVCREIQFNTYLRVARLASFVPVAVRMRPGSRAFRIATT